MDKNTFINILKTITDVMKCPSCGHTYELTEIQFISQMDGYCLVHLTCGNCQMPVWINFFAAGKKPDFKIQMDRPLVDFDSYGEITSDEIISFHESLKEFDGNFKKVFK